MNEPLLAWPGDREAIGRAWREFGERIHANEEPCEAFILAVLGMLYRMRIEGDEHD